MINEIQTAGDFRDDMQEILNRVELFHVKSRTKREKESNSEETMWSCGLAVKASFL